MPWQETDPVLERHHFAQDLDSGQWTMTELCLRYGISRNTGYKWLDRYRQSGPRGLYDHSRAPRSCPHETPADVVELILEEHRRFGWGARKILKRLRTRDPQRAWPARSTIFDILARHDRVQPRRRRRQWKHPGTAPFNTTAPNQIWTIDFKGQFRTRNGIYCSPLTLIDHFSRYLLGCHGLLDVAAAGVKPHLRHLFRTCGLPEAIRSDNGAPFASTGIHGLNRLNVWWLQLGITHQRITPGSPQENGAHDASTRPSRHAPLGPLPRISTPNSGCSTRSGRPTMSCGPMRPSMTRRPRRAGLHRLAPIPNASPHRSTPATSRCGASAAPAPSGSTRANTS
jgi:transposase InsO family protein